MSCHETATLRFENGCQAKVYVRTGLQGPPGPQGLQGPAGPSGGASGNSTLERETFTINATIISNKYITLTLPPSNAENLLMVYEGFLLDPISDYTWSPGTSRVTFADPLVARFTSGEQLVARRLTSA